jgi:splicing factor U2AF subunit
MVGNVYVKFRDEECAAKALMSVQGRYYAGRPIQIEFSPVTDFREATCRQYEENTCNRGGYCNFMHLKAISRDLRKHLFGRYKHSRWAAAAAAAAVVLALLGAAGARQPRSSHATWACGTLSHASMRPCRLAAPARLPTCPPPPPAPRLCPRSRSERGSERGKERRSRSRSRDKDRRGRSRSRDRSDRRDTKRETSEERRARIASWNKARDPATAAAPSAYGGVYGGGPPAAGLPPPPSQQHHGY